jgi:hypothetical protein
VNALRRFWQGDLGLGESFWVWGVLGGGVLALFITIFALMLLAFEAPPWAAVAMFVLDVPVNLYLLIGVWRSAGRPQVGADVRLAARVAIVAWALLLSLI